MAEEAVTYSSENNMLAINISDRKEAKKQNKKSKNVCNKLRSNQSMVCFMEMLVSVLEVHIAYNPDLN